MAERKRLSPEAAQKNILSRAEHYLIIGGPDAVRVQVIADDLGITDAAIHYHFGNRKGLMTALLKEAGRKLQNEIADIASSMTSSADMVTELAAKLTELYQGRKFGRLATWLAAEGWESEGQGLFDPIVKKLCEEPQNAQREGDVRYSLALLNTFLIGEDLVGGAFLASVSLAGDSKARAEFNRWVVRQIATGLALK
ncbi:TetR/AcrR family transcriptional regulator [Parvibaculaceae bacterium PLY_AMNH_Bact1]|nr:TetR/AcrR family transcriptional regulator [Parvibaculaceae bacterium PLY_AMNH_Bact1]